MRKPTEEELCDSGLHDAGFEYLLCGSSNTTERNKLNVNCKSIHDGAMRFMFTEPNVDESIAYLSASQACLVNGVDIGLERSIELKSPSMITCGNHAFVYIGAGAYSIEAHKYYFQSFYPYCDRLTGGGSLVKCGRRCLPGETNCDSCQQCTFRLPETNRELDREVYKDQLNEMVKDLPFIETRKGQCITILFIFV